MEKLGFDNKWINLINACIRSVTFSVMVNGEPQGFFQPHRGLHQGNPLSPYLFLLCAEGLHSLIHQAEDDGSLRWLLCVKMAQEFPIVFSQMSLLFCRANEQDCQKILEILASYELAFGQQINRVKTQLFFSSNTKPLRKTAIKNLLGV